MLALSLTLFRLIETSLISLLSLLIAHSNANQRSLGLDSAGTVERTATDGANADATGLARAFSCCSSAQLPCRRGSIRANQNSRILATEWFNGTASAPPSDSGRSSFCSPYSLNHDLPACGSTLIKAYVLSA